SPGMVATPVSGGYDVTYTPQTALTDGAHTVTVSVSDNDGNPSVATAVTYKVDTVPPTLNIASPADGLITSTAAQTIVGTTNDATSSPVVVTVSLNGTDQGAVSVSADGSFAKGITLAVGNNTIVVTSTDKAGKETSSTRHATLDTTSPVISAVTITPNPADAGATLSISVTIA
ncbi:MAG: Ig-like domain-containing protein, partial [Pseudoflavonifractor sp.]